MRHAQRTGSGIRNSRGSAPEPRLCGASHRSELRIPRRYEWHGPCFRSGAMWSTLLVVLLGALPRPVDAAMPAPGMPGALPTLPARPPILASPQAMPPSAAPPAGAPASAAPAAGVELARATDRAVARVAALEREHAAALADKTRLDAAYERQLQEIDRLKQGRASWRRDRLLREQLSASHETASALAAVDRKLRRLDATLRAARQSLVEAIDRELAAGPGRERRRLLARHRSGAERHLRRNVKKIVVPDERIDPLADPEELEHQAALLRESEAELAVELERMERQAERYHYMATLSDKRERAEEIGRLDDDQPRRTTGRSSASASSGSPDAPPPPEAGDPGEPAEGRGPPGDDFAGSLDVVLADVVDTPTLDALRAADRSSNPAVKARAVQQASDQVRARLERLRTQRARIQNRARTLRRR